MGRHHRARSTTNLPQRRYTSQPPSMQRACVGHFFFSVKASNEDCEASGACCARGPPVPLLVGPSEKREATPDKLIQRINT